jgi:hypothetical protein
MRRLGNPPTDFSAPFRAVDKTIQRAAADELVGSKIENKLHIMKRTAISKEVAFYLTPIQNPRRD